jgi:hypothetical protein
LQDTNPGYVLIPAGSNKDMSTAQITITPNHPKNVFRQSNMRAIRGCVVLSTANALHYAGYPITARNLAHRVFSSSRKAQFNGYACIKQIIHEKKMIDKHLRKNLVLKTIKNPNQWDIWVHTRDCVIATVTLEASDATKDHSIAISGGWIFDSNFTHGLEFNPENLNLCCSSKTKHCEFVRVVYGIVFEKMNPS